MGVFSRILARFGHRKTAIRLTFSEAPLTYNGRPQELAFSVTGLPGGYRAELALARQYRDTTGGPVPLEISQVRVFDKLGRDVSSRFDIASYAAFIQIDPAPLEIHTDSASKTYDGRPLTAPGSLAGLVGDDSAELVTTGEQVSAGESANTYAIRWGNQTKESNYRIMEDIGTLRVREFAGVILMSVRGGTFVFDGQPHHADVEVRDLPVGYRLKSAESSASVTSVSDGQMNVTVDSLCVVNAQGVDVTDRLAFASDQATIKVVAADIADPTRFSADPLADTVYDGREHKPKVTIRDSVTSQDLQESDILVNYIKDSPNVGTKRIVVTGRGNYCGSLILTYEVRPATLNVITYDKSKTYDGEPIVGKGRLGGLVPGEHATFSVTGRQVGIGSSTNTYALAFDKNARRSNYRIRESLGRLSVKAPTVPVVVIIRGGVFTYDGKPHGARIEVRNLPPHCQVQEASASGSVANVSEGTVEARIGHLVITDATGADVTESLELDVVPGHLMVLPVELSSERVVCEEIPDVTCDGHEHMPVPEVKDAVTNGYLTAGRDFTVSYSQNVVDAGTVEITIAGRGNYTGKRLMSFDIKPVEAPHKKALTVVVQSKSFVYDGKAHTVHGEVIDLPIGFSARVFLIGTVKNVSDGVTEAFFDRAQILDDTGKDVTDAFDTTFYAGTIRITPADISDDKRFNAVPPHSVTYDGLSHTPSLFLYDETIDRRLSEGTDYQIVYPEDTINAGKVTLEVRGMGNYCGSREVAFHIYPAQVIVVTPSARKIFDGKPLVSEGHVDGLVKGDEATLKTTGSQTQAGWSLNSYELVFGIHSQADNYEIVQDVGKLQVSPADISDETRFTCNQISPIVYDGKRHEPEVTVHDNEAARDLTPDDYRISLPNNLVDAGSKIMAITGRGNYAGTRTVSFEIAPAHLNVFTPDARKAYDGRPLATKSGARLMGLVPGETASIEAIGSQTEIGSAENDFVIHFDGTAKSTNYRIRRHLGTLTVTPAAELVESDLGIAVSTQTTASRASSNPEQGQNDRSGLEFLPAEQGAPERRDARHRPYRPRPIEKRPDLEEKKLGRGYHPFADYDPGSLPGGLPCIDTLNSLEPRARLAIQRLGEREDGQLVFRCFGEFAMDMEDLRKAFHDFFQHHRRDLRRGLAYIDKYYRNVFLIYVADLARIELMGDTLWQNLFKTVGIGVRNASYQQKFKEMFISYLYQYGLPVFSSTEKQRYMMETAVLHGGLTDRLWKTLWKKSFLPLAENALRGRGNLGPSSSGEAILTELTRPKSPYAPTGLVRDLFTKIQTSVVAPLCSAAWRVALQVCDSRNRSKMVTTDGLSDLAMKALKDTLAEGLPGTSTTKGQPSREVVYFAKCDFELDVATGVAKVTWKETPLPSSLSGARMDFYVNGRLAQSVPITSMTGRSVLKGGAIILDPSPRYDLEVRLMELQDDDRWVETRSTTQCFQSDKPGCLEFLGDRDLTDGVRYRFRDADERLRRTRRIAYLVEPGLCVEPRAGMELVNESPASGGWEGMSIFVFDVDPGAAGALVSRETGEEAYAWHEQFRATVDKSMRIGETTGGLDLYGHDSISEGGKVLLPSVMVESADADDAVAGLTIDGKTATAGTNPVSVGDRNISRLKLELTGANGVVASSDCELTVRQISTGLTILRYRFAIAPIADLRLEDGKALLRESYGIYAFDAVEAMDVDFPEGDNESTKAAANAAVPFQRELSAEYETIALTINQDLTMRARLYLVGLSVSASDALVEAEERGPICLATCEELGLANGDVKLSTRVPRPGRQVLVKLGERPLVYKDLSRASDMTLNIFENEDMFRGHEGRAVRIHLTIQVAFGRECLGGKVVLGTADIPLLDCAEGIGFSRLGLIRRGGDYDSSYDVVFRSYDSDRASIPTQCDLHLKFCCGQPAASCGETEASVGTKSVPLPDAASRRYARGESLRVQVQAVSDFGEPIEGSEFVQTFKRRR